MRSFQLPLLMLQFAAFSLAAAHDHFAAGISDANANDQADAGEPLAFVGPDGSDKIFHLLARPVGHRPIQRCGGYYMLDERPRTLFPTDSFSFTALSDGQIEIAAPGHAHTGSYIWLEIVSVEGPTGAHFGFWEQSRSLGFDTPTVSFATGGATGNFAFVLSEGTDEPAEDPQGHIHNRSWTADRAGDYRIGFRLVDRSTSGPGGGPWHTPSTIYYFHFKAGPSFQPVATESTAAGFKIIWPAALGYYLADAQQVGITFAIQRSTLLDPGSWETIGTVRGTTAATASFTDPTPPANGALYRLAYNWSVPSVH